MLPTRSCFRCKETQTENERMEKDVSFKQTPKESWVAKLISDKIYFETKMIIKDKDGHHITLKGSIQQEDITFANTYLLHREAPKYIKPMLTDLKGKFDSNAVIIWDFKKYLSLWPNKVNDL